MTRIAPSNEIAAIKRRLIRSECLFRLDYRPYVWIATRCSYLGTTDDVRAAGSTELQAWRALAEKLWGKGWREK